MNKEVKSALAPGKVESARIRVTNGNDAERVYDMTAVMEILGESVGSISSGQVRREDVQVAAFESHSPEGLNVNFMQSTDRAAITEAVEAFCNDIRENGRGLVSF